MGEHVYLKHEWVNMFIEWVNMFICTRVLLKVVKKFHENCQVWRMFFLETA